MKILIVDDSYLLCDRLRDALLQINGIEISGIATNGADALQMIKTKNPDFVILDIRMRGMSGITVLEKMKEQGSKSRVCIFTNYPYKQYREKCMKEGADYFFNKNEDLHTMIDLLTKQANRKKTKKTTN